MGVRVTGLSLQIAIDPEVLEAVRQSAVSLGGAADRLGDSGSDSLVFPDDIGDLFRCEMVSDTAAGAVKLHGIKITPSDRYLELVATVTAPGHAHVFRFVHGWPILSSVGRSPMMADGHGESISVPTSAERPA